MTHAISPLRQRMLEDMTSRRLVPHTQESYIRAVVRLTRFLGRSPDTATTEDIRRFQLHLTQEGVTNSTINATISGLRFFFEITLDHPETLKFLHTVYKPRKLPLILSPQEITLLLNAASGLKYKAALAVGYGAGLRAGEIVALRVTDIDSQRMLIRVEQGKGRKDRYAMLSHVLLILLRQWWQEARSKGRMLDRGWLFPGQDLLTHLSTRQLSRGCKAAAYAAGLDKAVSMHTLRHSFATHLLEQKVDIRVIQALLGHHRLDTTALYSQVATKTLLGVKSPLEHLQL